MHICFACSEYPPAPHGGIGSFVQTLGREFVRRGHNVSVLGIYDDGPKFEEESEDQGVRIFRIPCRGLPILRILPTLKRYREVFLALHRRSPIDIVESGEVELARVGSSFPGIKLLRMHGGPTYLGGQKLSLVRAERRSFQVADELCGVSHYVAENTSRLLHLDGRHIEVIPNPVDLDQFAPSLDSSEEEDGLIVFTGTVVELKGIRQLIQAMPRIVAEVPSARLEVYGGEATPAPRVPFAKVLNGLLPPAIARHVEWKGRVSRSVIPGALKRAAVCVFPSLIESMPLGWLEGLASGKAVVASRTGPGPEIIDDGVTGLLCDPYDPDSIAEKIIRLLRNAQERRELGAAARRIAVERYSLPKLVERNLNYYEHLLTKRHS